MLKKKTRKIILKEHVSDSEIPLIILSTYFKQKTGNKIYVYKSGKLNEDVCSKIKDINKPGKKRCIFNYYYFTDKDLGSKVDKNLLWCHEVGSFYEIHRDDEILVKIVEDYKLSHPDFKILKVVEIPRDVKWKVTEGEMGGEYIEEKSRIWH